MIRDGEELKVYCLSLGCPKNRVDTEHLLGSLGVELQMVDEAALADLVFINTCAFIEPAVRESIAAILDTWEEIKDRQERPLLVVAGCLVGRYKAESLASDLPEVDLFLDTADTPFWPSRIMKALGSESVMQGRLLSTGPSYAWLKIGEGCRHGCAFCTIPRIRGGLVSVTQEEIVREAGELLAQGVSELDLVAQDVSSYGQDQVKGHDALKALLEALCALSGLHWLRTLYLYPQGLTLELLNFMKGLGAPFLPYFDIPLQHAHPEILRRMGRPFEENPRAVLERVRSVFPEAALRTTVIVGFPGENDKHFDYLCRFVEESRFLHLGVFTYQREEGTRAFSYPDQVSTELAEKRRGILMEIQKEISREQLEKFVGERLPVLVDSVNPEWPGLHNGRVWFQAPEVDGQTYVSGPGVGVGCMVNAEIVEHSDYDLTALA